jgi:hypothetical protein
LVTRNSAFDPYVVLNSSVPGDGGFAGIYHNSDSINPIAALSNTKGNTTSGSVCAHDILTGTRACLFGNGSKPFIEPHPLHPGQSIVYIALEGPEAAMYLRGTARLEHGFANIALPEHFSVLAADQRMTATLTPNSAISKGLARIELTPTRLKVQELYSGTGSYDFDYTVFAVRERFVDFHAEQDDKTFGPGPSLHR